MSKRSAKPYRGMLVHRERQELRAKRFKYDRGVGNTGGAGNAGGAGNVGNAANPQVSKDTVYKASKEAAKKLAHTLHHGTEAQVDSAIHRLLRTKKDTRHSYAFFIRDADILEEIKTAMKALGVPEGRCFWKSKELEKKKNSLGDKPNIGNYWYHANGLKHSVARLAWLMWCEAEE